MTIRVLIVEDDADLRDSLLRYLGGAGFQVHAIADARALRHEIAQSSADVIVLDINLPGEVDGFAAAQIIRAETSAGIVILTGRSMRDDRLHGLAAGADHYLIKPIDLAELEMVIRNLHKRMNPAVAEAPASAPAAPEWGFDATQWVLTSPNGVRVGLSGVEHRLIERLTAQPGAAVARAELAAAIGRQMEDPSGRGLDLIVFRLRRKIEKECGQELPILSSRGVGYVFAAPLKQV